MNDTIIEWRPSSHLPKEKARIWLRIEKKRVERLHDISIDDAISEGIECVDNSGKKPLYRVYTGKNRSTDSPIESYFSWWQKMRGIEAVNSNPWVWVIKFKVLSTTGKPTTNS